MTTPPQQPPQPQQQYWPQQGYPPQQQPGYPQPQYPYQQPQQPQQAPQSPQPPYQQQPGYPQPQYGYPQPSAPPIPPQPQVPPHAGPPLVPQPLPEDQHVPTFRPTTDHPAWPREGDPGVEAFRPSAKKLSLKLYLTWVPILIAQFAVWTLLVALVPQFAGVKPPVAADFAGGVLVTIASSVFLWTKFKKGALSTVVLVSPVGIHMRDNLGFDNRIAWPDMAKVARVVAMAGSRKIQVAGSSKSFQTSEMKDMGVIGWGVREVPPAYLERFRASLAKLAWDPASRKHYISIPISVIEPDWVNGRIAQLIQQYRPDLAWDMHAEEFAMKTIK